MTTLWHGFDMATMVGGQYNLQANAAIATQAGKIVWLGDLWSSLIVGMYIGNGYEMMKC